MAWVVTAISAGTAIYGAVEGKKGAKRARDASSAAAAEANEADAAALEFAQQQHAEWQQTFGPIEDNLSEYYQNLSPTSMTAQALEAHELEKDEGLKGLRENLAQRGLSTSGITAQTEITVENASIAERAKIRAEAPAKVAQEKLGFLQVGMQKDAATGVQNTLNQQAGGAGSRAGMASQLAGDARASELSSRANLVNTIGETIENVRNKPKRTPAPVVDAVPAAVK